MKNIEQMIERRKRTKEQMDEVRQSERASHFIKSWLGDLNLLNQAEIEKKLGQAKGLGAHENTNGMTLVENLDYDILFERVVRGAIIRNVKERLKVAQNESTQSQDGNY